MKRLQHARLSLAAGFFIAIGGIAYLAIGGLVGAAAFSIGLLLTFCFGARLFTGLVGFSAKDRCDESLITCLAFNILAAACAGIVCPLCFPEAATAAQSATAAKLASLPSVVFVKGCLCGALMYSAAKVWFLTDRRPELIVVVALCVFVFVACGFEHCVADAFFFCAAGAEPRQAARVVAVAVLGNSCGAIGLRKLTEIK